MIYLMDVTTALVLFALDCDDTEERNLEIDWTEKPIESGSIVSDFGVDKPEVFPVAGFMTAWSLDTGYDATALSNADKTLRQIALQKQPIWLVTETWTEEVVLSKVNAKRSVSDGDMMPVSMECRIIRTTSPKTTHVPPSRLKPSVKSGAALRPKGGAGASKTPSAVEQGQIDATVDALKAVH